MSKKIKYALVPDLYIDLEPSAKNIPDWYKKASPWSGSGKPFVEDYTSNRGMKLCMPFLDSLTSGYQIPLWTDIQVRRNNDGTIELAFMHAPDPLHSRSGENSLTFPTPPGCGPQQYAWHWPFFMETPPGYSSLITHPINRFDLPFISLTGIVDTDATMYPGNLPFFLKNDFEGIIKRGTPIAQVIPFKRDNWESEKDDKIIKSGLKNKFLGGAELFGYYKRNSWKRKEFK
jgi:hypothetical protein